MTSKYMPKILQNTCRNILQYVNIASNISGICTKYCKDLAEIFCNISDNISGIFEQHSYGRLYCKQYFWNIRAALICPLFMLQAIFLEYSNNIHIAAFIYCQENYGNVAEPECKNVAQRLSCNIEILLRNIRAAYCRTISIIVTINNKCTTFSKNVEKLLLCNIEILHLIFLQYANNNRMAAFTYCQQKLRQYYKT